MNHTQKDDLSDCDLGIRDPINNHGRSKRFARNPVVQLCGDRVEFEECVEPIEGRPYENRGTVIGQIVCGHWDLTD